MAEESRLSPEQLLEGTDRFRIDGDVALITGAASGIGRVVAFVLADAGADIAIADRQAEQVRSVGNEIDDHFDVNVTSLTCDVSDPESVESMVDDAVKDLGTVDVLCNIAGVSRESNTESVPEKEWDLIQNVNLKGTYLCSQAAFPHLKGGGRIVNMSSFVARYGSSTMSHYAAAKAGIRNFTRSLAGEWATDNVRVNAVAPAPIFTAGITDLLDVTSEEALDREPIDRELGSPAEVADAMLFLASRASSFISGETVFLEGVPAVQEDISRILG